MINRWRHTGLGGRTGVDVAVALVLIVVMEVYYGLTTGMTTAERVVTAVAAVPYGAPISFRRVWPARALVTSAAVVLISMFLGGQILSNGGVDVIPLLLLGYSAGASADDERSTRSILTTLAVLWAWAIAPRPGDPMDDLGQIVQAIFFVSLLVVPTWLIGWFVRHRQERSVAFRELAAATAAELNFERAEAVALERQRIGTELQNLITQSVDQMIEQALLAQSMLASDQPGARATILGIEENGREALGDLRRLLGILRKDDDPRALSPQPGLGQLDSLLATLRGAGFACPTEIVGEPIDLPPGLDLVAYRVVEAALTAAAGPDPGQGALKIRYRRRDVQIEVRGDRHLPNPAETFSGVAQRMALYDGALRTEETADGFVLRAWLPLAVASHS